MTDEEKKVWDEWVSSRPDIIKNLCIKFPPNLLFKMKDTGHRVTVYSYSDDNTMTVNVTGKYNVLTFDRRVFGIKPEDLEECNIPKDSETVGTIITKPEEVEAHINAIRPIILGSE